MLVYVALVGTVASVYLCLRCYQTEKRTANIIDKMLEDSKTQIKHRLKLDLDIIALKRELENKQEKRGPKRKDRDNS